MDVTASSRSAGVVNTAGGSFTSDATAAVVTLGFRPSAIKVVNATDVIVWDKLDTMADTLSVKTVTAGTTTADATSAIVISDTGFTISAAAAGTGKAIHWVAYA